MLSRKKLENEAGPRLHFVTNIDNVHRSSIQNLKYSKPHHKKSRINAYGQSFQLQRNTKDPFAKVAKAMNLVYNNQANIHNNMLMRRNQAVAAAAARAITPTAAAANALP